MTRPSELTRDALVESATAIFAENGFEGGSVRLITERAKANQAAVSYHFGSKEGLYREVLRRALHAFDEFVPFGEDELDAIDREEALRLFLRQQLLPLAKRNQVSRYLRIFNWEVLQRTAVFHELLATERIPTVAIAQALVRKFLPSAASPEEGMVVTIWLVNQAFIFVRNYDSLSQPPANLKVDEAFLTRLVDTLSRLLIGGLAGLSAASPGLRRKARAGA
jgi:AcrR family transcriptional regulator